MRWLALPMIAVLLLSLIGCMSALPCMLKPVDDPDQLVNAIALMGQASDYETPIPAGNYVWMSYARVAGGVPEFTMQLFFALVYAAASGGAFR